MLSSFRLGKGWGFDFNKSSLLVNYLLGSYIQANQKQLREIAS